MIIVFTSLHYGGMLQFSTQIAQSFQNIGYEVIAYLPKNTPDLTYPFIKKYSVPQKALSYIHEVKVLAKEILNQSPEKVIFSENSLLSCLLLHELKGKIPTILSIHDAIAHPTNNKLLELREKFKLKIKERACKDADTLLFMSEYVKSIFFSTYKNINKKYNILPLGAHIPKAEECIPQEIQSNNDYSLFFGRIDKYKGIERLLKTYLVLLQKHEKIPTLVIAGKGIFTKLEEQLIIELKIINRFISDGEMKWLINHCNFVCLPYIEASQSGVLPMAYYYSKPVIVSNLPGLTQFVIEGQTGFIFHNEKELEDIITKLYNSINRKYYEECIKNYFEENLNWENNLIKILKN